MLHNCMRFMALVCVGATQPAPHATKVTKGAKQLHAAFTKSFQEIYDLFSALQARQSDAPVTLCLSDEELARLHAAYKSVHGLMDPAAAGYLFTQVDDELMHSFLGSCAQQALAGVARSVTGLQGVCTPEASVVWEGLYAVTCARWPLASFSRTCADTSQGHCKHCRLCLCMCTSSQCCSPGNAKDGMRCRPAVTPPRWLPQHLRPRRYLLAFWRAQHARESLLRSSTWRRCASCCRRRYPAVYPADLL